SRQLSDHAGADRRVLGDNGRGVVGHLDHLVLGLALGGGQLEPGLLDDRPLDVDVAEVVVRDHDRLGRRRHAVPRHLRAAGSGEGAGRPLLPSSEAPCAASLAMRSYSDRIPWLWRGGRGDHRAGRSARISVTSSSGRRSPSTPTTARLRSGTLSSIRSFSSISAIGPPSSASGATCPMHGPRIAPEYRPSVTIAVVWFSTGSAARIAAAKYISGMPLACGPSYRMTMTSPGSIFRSTSASIASGSSSKTLAGPTCTCIAPATEKLFTIAPSGAMLPRRMAIPPSLANGSWRGRMISSRRILTFLR